VDPLLEIDIEALHIWAGAAIMLMIAVLCLGVELYQERRYTKLLEERLKREKKQADTSANALSTITAKLRMEGWSDDAMKTRIWICSVCRRKAGL
jgi:hypothetical protein